MKTIDDLLDKKIELLGITLRVVEVLFFAVMLGLGLSMRIALFEYESGDYHYFLSVWMQECHDAGGIGYLGIEPFSSSRSTINYGCMYQYIIILLHYLQGLMTDIALLKSVSVIFDVVCAVTIMRIAYLVTGEDVKKALISFGAVMVLPTVVLNSSAWTQCDSIYVSFMLLSLLHLMKGNGNRTFIYLTLAYSFKQQAIFLIPLLIILWLMGKVKLRYILWFPVVIFITIIPALLAGRKLSELLSIYGEQVNTYTYLTMNYPSIYSVVSEGLKENNRKMIISAGTMATVMVLGVIAFYIRDKKVEVTNEFIITLAIFTIEVCLFILPVMHERYGYFPEILAVVYGVTRYKRMVVCAFLQVISVITYSRFLFGSMVTVIWPLAIGLFMVIMFLGYDLKLQMDSKEVRNA